MFERTCHIVELPRQLPNLVSPVIVHPGRQITRREMPAGPRDGGEAAGQWPGRQPGQRQGYRQREDTHRRRDRQREGNNATDHRVTERQDGLGVRGPTMGDHPLPVDGLEHDLGPTLPIQVKEAFAEGPTRQLRRTRGQWQRGLAGGITLSVEHLVVRRDHDGERDRNPRVMWSLHLVTRLAEQPRRRGVFRQTAIISRRKILNQNCD